MSRDRGGGGRAGAAPAPGPERSADAEAALAYCAEQVRRYDHDRYLTALFAPRGRRALLLALYAFNLEVAKTAEVVSEPMLGRMRLQWWREAVEAIYAGRPPRHQVAIPLVEAVARHDLDRGHFERLIDAREFDLEGAAPDSLAALEVYAEATSSSLVYLALEVLGAAGSETIAAGRHVGIAWALTGLLRAVPFHARQRRIYLPGDLVAEAGLATRDLFELRSPPALHQVVARIATAARGHLAAARRFGPEAGSAAFPALLPAVLAEDALGNLRRAGHDPFDPRVQRPSPVRAWRLAAARLRRRF